MKISARSAALALAVTGMLLGAAGMLLTVASAAHASSPFANCTEAYEAGYSHIPAVHPYYGKHLDRDSDGIACDNPPAGFVPAASARPTLSPTPTSSATPSGKEDLAETGGISPLPFVMGAGFLILAGGTFLTVRRRTR